VEAQEAQVSQSAWKHKRPRLVSQRWSARGPSQSVSVGAQKAQASQSAWKLKRPKPEKSAWEPKRPKPEKSVSVGAQEVQGTSQSSWELRRQTINQSVQSAWELRAVKTDSQSVSSVSVGAESCEDRQSVQSAWELRAVKTDSPSETDRQRPEKVQDRALGHQSQEF
jgi:hypothetical protein